MKFLSFSLWWNNAGHDGSEANVLAQTINFGGCRTDMQMKTEKTALHRDSSRMAI
jgi:hypothetical protein